MNDNNPPKTRSAVPVEINWRIYEAHRVIYLLDDRMALTYSILHEVWSVILRPPLHTLTPAPPLVRAILTPSLSRKLKEIS